MITVEHWENGNIMSVRCKNDTGEWHNPNGTAIQEWYETGQERSREYWVDGNLHNPNGPAYQEWYVGGQEKLRSYWVDGKWHNQNGPALQKWHENGQESYRAYYVDGKPHNPNGPAFQSWHENGQERARSYWVAGKILTEEEFLSLQNTVEIVVEGKTTRISRESAKSLNLIKE